MILYMKKSKVSITKKNFLLVQSLRIHRDSVPLLYSEWRSNLIDDSLWEATQ